MAGSEVRLREYIVTTFVSLWKKSNVGAKYKEGGFTEEIYLVFSIIYQVKSLIKP